MPMTLNGRDADHDIEPMFLQRWSPRAFTSEAIPDELLMSMFEAARWAPSAGNGQPWRFVYAKRDTPEWAPLFETLNPGNQAWVQTASVLMFVVADKMRARPDGQLVPNPTYAFDCGTAWGYLALQAHHLGWAAHGMAGFDREKAAAAMGMDESRHQVMAAVAIGRAADRETLSDEQKTRETPNGRRPIGELVSVGVLGR